MISEKLEANRQSVQESTGPSISEERAAVSLNSITHGLRARDAVMLIEDPAEFRRLCAEIYDEFRPMSTTEGDLVEQMAVYRWKMARMEALISSSALQSTLMHMAFKDPVEFKTERGTILMPDMADQNEQGIHRMLYQLEQQQGRIQKAYFTALKTLERLQARRPRPVTVNLESQTASTEIVRTAGAAGGGLEVTSQDRKPAGSVRRL